jgi:hypothetical protein
MKLRHLTALALLGATAAHAADSAFHDEAAFLLGAGSVAFESFETLAARSRSLDPIVTARFTIRTGGAPIGVQSGADTPDPGFGAAAVDGSHYVSVYLPGQPQGSIRFDLAAPSRAFGLYLADAGEAAGQITFQTNAGAFTTTLVVGEAPPLLPNGNVRFIGFTQDQAFTQVTLTVTGLDDAYGVDKVYVSAVPEPASAALLGLGLAGIAARRSRRR